MKAIRFLKAVNILLLLLDIHLFLQIDFQKFISLPIGSLTTGTFAYLIILVFRYKLILSDAIKWIIQLNTSDKDREEKRLFSLLKKKEATQTVELGKTIKPSQTDESKEKKEEKSKKSRKELAPKIPKEETKEPSTNMNELIGIIKKLENKIDSISKEKDASQSEDIASDDEVPETKNTPDIETTKDESVLEPQQSFGRKDGEEKKGVTENENGEVAADVFLNIEQKN